MYPRGVCLRPQHISAPLNKASFSLLYWELFVARDQLFISDERKNSAVAEIKQPIRIITSPTIRWAFRLLIGWKGKHEEEKTSFLFFVSLAKRSSQRRIERKEVVWHVIIVFFLVNFLSMAPRRKKKFTERWFPWTHWTRIKMISKLISCSSCWLSVVV